MSADEVMDLMPDERFDEEPEKPILSIWDGDALVRQIRNAADQNDASCYLDAFLRKFLINPHLGGMKVTVSCPRHEKFTFGCYACTMKQRSEVQWTPDLKL